MSERTRGEGFSIREKMLKLYNIDTDSRGTFFLQVDWILENAVFPKENGYAENLMDLWNVYLPNYTFNGIILEYSKKFFPVLRYVHDGEVYKFNSEKHMQETAIKNYVKSRISQGETNRMTLVKDCFDVAKDVSDRTKLYNVINYTIEGYFQNGEIEQYGVMFLKRFQDYTNQPYVEIFERLSDIREQKELSLNARHNLFNSLKVDGEDQEKFQTLINILLCKIAVADGEQRFSDVLQYEWNKIMPKINYNEKVYTFIEKYEKAYMNAACYSIKDIKDGKVIRQLYKDAVILCAVVEAVEKRNRYGIREVNDFWKRDGMKFSNGYYFNDEYERMKGGFNPDILLVHKADVEKFHTLLLKKIEAADFSIRNPGRSTREKINVPSEMDHIALNVKDHQIEELRDRVAELEEKIDNTEKEVLSQFISLLDSKKYDHVLGKLYRTAYVDDVKPKDIQRILKNLFEIMNISGIDVYGEIGAEVKGEDVKRGKYRVDRKISEKATIKYPGYRVGDSVILHPFAEEV